MEKMSLEDHVELTNEHLRKMEADAEDRIGEARLKAEIREKEPTAMDYELGRLTPVQREMDHEQAAHNILRTIEENERAGNGFSWQRKKTMLRNALLELDKLLSSLGTKKAEHPEKLELRERVANQLADMERFETERHLTEAVDELADKSGVYQQVMREVWESVLEDPVAREVVNADWRRSYEAAERALIDAMKQQKIGALDDRKERVWLSFVLSKLDVADAVLPDEIAKDMKAFVLRKLRELESRESAR